MVLKHFLLKFGLVLTATNFVASPFAWSANCQIGTNQIGHLVNLVVGDAGGDGHEKTEKVLVCSNRNRQEMQRALDAGEKILGFDFTHLVASEYDDRFLKEEYLLKMKEHGFKFEDEDEDEGDSDVYLGWDQYADITLWIMQLGDKGFKFEIVDAPEINVGGYGLFE